LRDLSYGPGMLLEGGGAGSGGRGGVLTLRQACALLLILLMHGQVLWKLGWDLGASAIFLSPAVGWMLPLALLALRHESKLLVAAGKLA
jgi:hypothetical protein